VRAQREHVAEAFHIEGGVLGKAAAAAVGQHGIFAEAAARVIGFSLDYHISAEREMMRYVPPVPIHRGDHLGDARSFQLAARGARLADIGEFEAAGRWETQSPALRHKAGRVAHGRHLDRGLRSIDEAVEHFRIDRTAVLDL